jgi:hypothetical protein
LCSLSPTEQHWNINVREIAEAYFGSNESSQAFHLESFCVYTMLFGIDVPEYWYGL